MNRQSLAPDVLKLGIHLKKSRVRTSYTPGNSSSPRSFPRQFWRWLFLFPRCVSSLEGMIIVDSTQGMIPLPAALQVQPSEKGVACKAWSVFSSTLLLQGICWQPFFLNNKTPLQPELLDRAELAEPQVGSPQVGSRHPPAKICWEFWRFWRVTEFFFSGGAACIYKNIRQSHLMNILCACVTRTYLSKRDTKV